MQTFYVTHGKRILDTTLASVLLLILSPLLAIIAVSVRLTMGSPVLFRQIRPGQGGKPFEILKFRTMTDRRDDGGAPLADAERLTAFGNLLRRTSLDELPELWNVVKGEMSLVGPRPLLMQYLPLYTPEEYRRHEALPGITGLAQISGRNELRFENRFELDVYYVEHAGFLLDLRILLRTLVTILKREGINQQGHATVDYFKRSDHNEPGQ